MSSSCGACINLKKKILPDLEKDLKNDPRFRYLSLEFSEKAIGGKEVDGKEFHPELKNGFVEYFPTFLLFPGNLWNNKNSKLKGVPKHDLKKNPQIDYSKASILSWIENTLKRDPLFNGGNTEVIENLKPLEDGKYVVPTYGTYNRFKGTKTDN